MFSHSEGCADCLVVGGGMCGERFTLRALCYVAQQVSYPRGRLSRTTPLRRYLDGGQHRALPPKSSFAGKGRDAWRAA